MGPAPQKTSQDPNCLIKENQFKNNIFGRHASNSPNVEGNFASKGDIDFSVTKFRFYDKFKEVTTNTLPQKGFGYPKQIHVSYSVTKDRNYGINQTPRKTIVHCSGTAFKENSAQILVTTTNLGSERNEFLSNQNKIKLTVTGRAKVVEGEFTSSEVTSLSGNHDEGTWSYQEKTKHINVLELVE